MQEELRSLESFLMVGTRAVIKVNPDDETAGRYMVTLSGWRRGEFLIFECSIEHERKGQGLNRQIGRLPVHTRSEVVVRFVSDGLACGFRETVVETMYVRDVPHFVTKWPTQFEQVKVREEQRYEVSASAVIVTEEGERIRGRITDLSLHGCGLLLDRALRAGEAVEVAMEMQDGTEIFGVVCIVRNAVECDEGCFRVGAVFDQVPAAASRNLERYITVLKANTPGNTEHSDVVLMLTPDANDRTLLDAVEQLGREVFYSTNVAEFFYHARVLRPAAVILDCAHDGWSGMDVCSYIRSCPQMKDLRMALVGIPRKHVDVSTRILGADVCIPDDVTDVKEIFIRIREELCANGKKAVAANGNTTAH